MSAPCEHRARPGRSTNANDAPQAPCYRNCGCPHRRCLSLGERLIRFGLDDHFRQLGYGRSHPAQPDAAGLHAFYYHPAGNGYLNLGLPLEQRPRHAFCRRDLHPGPPQRRPGQSPGPGQGLPGPGRRPQRKLDGELQRQPRPGQWQVWDSSPTTWSFNAQSGEAGYADVTGNAASSAPPTFRPCFHNTYSPLEMGPCSGPRGTTIQIAVVTALSSPLVKVLFANGTARVIVSGLKAGGTMAGSYYTFPAPADLCLAGRGSSTWQAFAWDANGLRNPRYSLYGDLGNFGEYTITGC